MVKMMSRKPKSEYAHGKHPNTRANQFGQPGAPPTRRNMRVKGLAKAIGLESNNGQEFIDFAFQVFRNNHPELPNITFAQRWDAMVFLMNRGHGKAPVVIETNSEVTNVNVIDFQGMDEAKLLELTAKMDDIEGLLTGKLVDV